MATHYRAGIELLIEDYSRRRKTISKDLYDIPIKYPNEDMTSLKERLSIKSSCYATFISELNKILQQ